MVQYTYTAPAIQYLTVWGLHDALDKHRVQLLEDPTRNSVNCRWLPAGDLKMVACTQGERLVSDF